jgi:uncharacterized protein (DUF983 family)
MFNIFLKYISRCNECNARYALFWAATAYYECSLHSACFISINRNVLLLLALKHFTIYLVESFN